METALQLDQEAEATVPRRSVVLPLLAAVLVMLSFLTLPRAATDLDLDSDASLGEVLGYAHQQGLQFGTDFVSTYGPLGYVIFVYFSPRTAGTVCAMSVRSGTSSWPTVAVVTESCTSAAMSTSAKR